MSSSPQQRQLSINSCPLKKLPIWLAESSAQCQQASKAVRAQPWGSSLWRRDTHLGSPRILATCFLLVKSFVSWEQHRTAWSWVKARAEIFKVYRERLICTPNVWVRTSRNLNQALKTGKLDVLEKHEKALELVSSHADLESSQRSNHLKVDLSNSLSQSYRTKGRLLGNPRHCKLCIRDGSFACDLIVP